MRLVGATITLPPLQSRLRRNFSAAAAGLADQAACLLRRSFAVEEHRSRLHRGDLHHRIDVTHPRT